MQHRRITWRLAALSGIISPSLAAAEPLPFLHAPASAEVAPAPKLGVLYELRVRLPEGLGLARTLLDAGVNSDDAAAAARVAAGHLGDGLGGCDAKVSISRMSRDGELRVERISLVTTSGATVIERRQGRLTIASEAARLSPLV
jgi:hypothetical protein